METKQEIVSDWLHRYTGKPSHEFGKYILLTNFYKYVSKFAEITGTTVEGKDRVMASGQTTAYPASNNRWYCGL